MCKVHLEFETYLDYPKQIPDENTEDFSKYEWIERN